MAHAERYDRVPRHVGFIPDGNRRWAEQHGLRKEEGYAAGIPPALRLYRLCREIGIEEVSVYGFTQENTHRPPGQVRAFQQAVVEAVEIIKGLDASLLIVGDSSSKLFPSSLLPYTRRVAFGKGTLRINVLVNYSWTWDLNMGNGARRSDRRAKGIQAIGSRQVSRINLIVRWGGRRRLSGFLPVQSAYSDIYVIDSLWPDFEPEQFQEAIRWYGAQEVTLGG